MLDGRLRLQYPRAGEELRRRVPPAYERLRIHRADIGTCRP